MNDAVRKIRDFYAMTPCGPGQRPVSPRFGQGPNLEEALAIGATALPQAANAILPRRPQNLLHKKVRKVWSPLSAERICRQFSGLRDGRGAHSAAVYAVSVFYGCLLLL